MPRRLIPLIFFTACLLVILPSRSQGGSQPSSPAFRYDQKGLEWTEMTMSDKRDVIFAAMTLMTQNGVTLKGTILDYYNLVQNDILKDPSLNDRTIPDILALAVYRDDPSTREALDRLKKHPDLKKIEMH